MLQADSVHEEQSQDHYLTMAIVFFNVYWDDPKIIFFFIECNVIAVCDRIKVRTLDVVKWCCNIHYIYNKGGHQSETTHRIDGNHSSVHFEILCKACALISFLKVLMHLFRERKPFLCI